MTGGSRETGTRDVEPSPTRDPGDESRPGSKQSGDQICPTCSGSGRINNAACTDCGGTGRITAIVGDA
jgi:RecJ-like exonuclease